MKVHILALVLTMTVPPATAAQEAVFLVRHAERADSSPDSTLSTAGEARAIRLSEWMRTAHDNIFLVVPRGNAEPSLFRFKY